MPNHVKNVLTFKNLKKEDMDFIVNTIAIESEDTPSTYWIDFNKIIPEPRTEDECPDEYKVNKDSHVRTYDDKPWFDWYKWRNEFWDTKWNAYDKYSILDDSTLTFVFSTAWSYPEKVIKRLRLLGYDFELKYADEDYGCNCGMLQYHSKEDLFTRDVSSIIDPGTFSEELWSTY